MTTRDLKRIKEKKNCFLGIKCFFFLIVIVFSVGNIDLKAAETETKNPGVEKVELDLQPGSAYVIPVWQSLPGDDEWVFNYHYIYERLRTYVKCYGIWENDIKGVSG